MALFALTAALITGLLLGLSRSEDCLVIYAFAAFFFLTAILAKKIKVKHGVLSLICLGLLCLGYGRGCQTRSKQLLGGNLADTGVHTVICQISSFPKISGLTQQFYCLISALDSDKLQPRSMILVHAPAHYMVAPEDFIEFSGALVSPASAEPSYKEYLQRRGVTAVTTVKELVITPDEGFHIERSLYLLRRQVSEQIKKAVPQPEASLINGITLGADDGLPVDERESLRNAGLLHILVVSGMNVSLLIVSIVGVLRRWCNWRICFITVLVVGITYAILTGGDPPVVRAVIMALVVIGGHVVGRPNYGPNALCFAAVVMAFITPSALLEGSYQLSVTATAGMLWAESDAMPEAAGIIKRAWQGIRTTFAAQLATLPLLAALFGQIPLLALLSNCLVLPVQGPLMVSAGITALLSFLPPQILTWLAAPAWLFARYTLGMAELVSHIPWAMVTVPKPSWLLVAVYYLVLFILAARRFCWRCMRKLIKSLQKQGGKYGRSLLLPMTLALAGIIWLIVLRLPDGRLHLTFFSVGNGDSMLLTTPRGKRVLIDGGKDPDLLLAQLGRHMPFGQRRLDAVIITHADMDHMGGVLGVKNRYRINYLVEPMTPVASAWQAEWQALRSAAGSTVTGKAGLRLVADDGVVIEVLYPDGDVCPEWAQTDNDCSLVMQITYGEMKFLITGDAGTEVERYLLKQGKLSPVMGVKVSHHGSKYGTSLEFLNTIAPRLAVIPVGGNQYGHPSEEAIKRLQMKEVPWLRTDQAGNIDISSDSHLYAVDY